MAERNSIPPLDTYPTNINFLDMCFTKPIGDEAGYIYFLEIHGRKDAYSIITRTPIYTQKYVSLLKEATHSQNSSEIKMTAHNVKGIASSILAPRLAMFAKLIELSHLDLDSIRKNLPDFEDTCDETINWWNDKLVKLKRSL